MDIIRINDTSNKLYYVGGVVRDEILGIESFDIDMTYEGNAIKFAQILAGWNDSKISGTQKAWSFDIPSNSELQSYNAEILQINEPFGTVRMRIDGREIDIASTRTEVYDRKGHLPAVTKIGCSLKEDVMRRDFTINTLAKSVSTGEIIDYTGGLEDIKNKTLHVLHDKSFIDDPTRILRGLKFSVRFGFELDKHTKKLQEDYLKNINYDMCYKRIKKELIETFNLNSQKAFEKFINESIYKLVTTKDVALPQINIEKLINKYFPPNSPDANASVTGRNNVWIIYAGVLEDLSRLPLTKTEQKILDDFKYIGELKSDFEIYKTFEKMALETIILYAVLKNYDTAVHYLDNLQKIKLSINGNDLQKIGFAPSQKFSAAFDAVLKQKLSNPNLTKNEELIIAQNYLAG